jgi:hypothetical protein
MDPAKIKALLDAITADDPEAIKAAAIDLVSSIAAPGEPGAEPPPVDPLAADAEPPPVQLAALAALREHTGCAALGEAIVMLAAWKAERAKQAELAAVLEESSRVGLVAELVTLGAETPATAWEGEGAARKMVARLTSEPVADLRKRVVALRALGPRVARPEPPESASEQVTLSAETLAQIKAKGMTVDQFLAARKSAVKRAV